MRFESPLWSTANLEDGSVTTPKLANLAVTEIKVAAGAITVTKYADGSITSIKIGTSEVQEINIGGGAITVTKLGDGSVTEIKVGGGAITVTKIGTGAVTEIKIGSAAVSSVKLAATLQSDNFVAGSAGWQITRNTGNAEFNVITARGEIIATSGTFSGVTINGILTMNTAGLIRSAPSGERVEIGAQPRRWTASDGSQASATRVAKRLSTSALQAPGFCGSLPVRSTPQTRSHSIRCNSTPKRRAAPGSRSYRSDKKSGLKAVSGEWK